MSQNVGYFWSFYIASSCRSDVSVQHRNKIILDKTAIVLFKMTWFKFEISCYMCFPVYGGIYWHHCVTITVVNLEFQTRGSCLGFGHLKKLQRYHASSLLRVNEVGDSGEISQFPLTEILQHVPNTW